MKRAPLPEGKLEQLQQAALRRGVPFEWANLTDALQSERDQNITIDTTQIWFRTRKRDYVLIDAPGHKEFLKNMVTGAASADAALLVIDAKEGVQEQSRRHGYLLHLLGVRQIAVEVNKMDAIGFDPARFEAIATEYRIFLENLGLRPAMFIPVSAKEGDNIAVRSGNLRGGTDRPYSTRSTRFCLLLFPFTRTCALSFRTFTVSTNAAFSLDGSNRGFCALGTDSVPARQQGQHGQKH
jgi:sulfate adenylyltransferase subunit 1 (EFTu-like GTPase family)